MGFIHSRWQGVWSRRDRRSPIDDLAIDELESAAPSAATNKNLGRVTSRTDRRTTGPSVRRDGYMYMYFSLAGPDILVLGMTRRYRIHAQCCYTTVSLLRLSETPNQLFFF